MARIPTVLPTLTIETIHGFNARQANCCAGANRKRAREHGSSFSDMMASMLWLMLGGPCEATPLRAEQV